MRFSLEALEALLAIERHGSFAAASKALRKAQSAVSYSIKQLEEGLGLELFDRAGHKAVLTDAGRAVVEEARVVLAGAERLERMAARLREDWEPRMSVVLDGILPMEPVMRALRRMADEAIPTQIQLKVEFLGGVQDRFEEDRADVMLVKDYVRGGALREHALPEVTCVLVTSARHPLAQEGAVRGPLALHDLQRHVELTVHDSSRSRRLVDTRLFGGPRVFYLSDFATKKQAITMGLGFGWMPLYLVEHELAAGELVEVAFPGARYAFVPRLVHREERPLGRAGERFLALLLEQRFASP